MSEPQGNCEELYSDTDDSAQEEGQKLVFDIPDSHAGQRLDKVLRDLESSMSRAQWQRLVREGNVFLKNGTKPIRANYKVSGGEQVIAVIPPPAESELIPENIPLDIIYEDEHMLAINKPAGLVMHPAVGHATGTVANAIVYHYPNVLNVGGERRPGLVHRLDKDTSGIVLIAKNDFALNHLVSQFKARTTKKVYLALVDGHIKPEAALIDAPLGRNPADRKRMAVIPEGKNLMSQPSQTRYETRELFDEHTLVTCYPVTGRTHQIRVHLSYINYPIVGDRVYGRRKQTIHLKRHFLHAFQIEFRRPKDDELIQLEVPLPADLEQVVQKLRAQVL